MSQAVRRAANQTKASSGYTRSVLTMLVSHMNEDGFAWPSLRTLEAETGWCRHTIVDALDELEQLGEIKRFRRGHVPDVVRRATKRTPKGGWQATNCYYVTLLRPAELQVVHRMHHQGGAQPPVQVVHASLVHEVPVEEKGPALPATGSSPEEDGAVTVWSSVLMDKLDEGVPRERLHKELMDWCGRHHGWAERLTPELAARAIALALQRLDERDHARKQGRG